LIPAGFDVTMPPASTTSVSLGTPTTVSVVLALWPPNAAVMVADPRPMLVARPVSSIVATVESLLVHAGLIPTTEAGRGALTVVP
jgi:hypothetical protein